MPPRRRRVTLLLVESVLTVTVPATTANLGPGFDALGLAVDLRLSVHLRLPTGDDATRERFTYRGEGPAPVAHGNLVRAGFEAVYRHLSLNAPDAIFEVDNPIPLARGLGSSSAALVAGAALAAELSGSGLDRGDLFALTAELEGHPDNVAPAIYGGFTASALGDDGLYVSAALPLPPEWRLLFAVPAFALTTRESRSVLPPTLPFSDAVRTASRAALWVAAVATNQPALLRVASKDVMHEPLRARLVPGLIAAQRRALELGAYAAFLSGAGPTLAVVCRNGTESDLLPALSEFAGERGRVLALSGATGFELSRC